MDDQRSKRRGPIGVLIDTAAIIRDDPERLIVWGVLAITAAAILLVLLILFVMTWEVIEAIQH